MDKGKEVAKKYFKESGFNCYDFDYERSKKNPDLFCVRKDCSIAVQVKLLELGERYRKDGTYSDIVPRTTNDGQEKIKILLHQAAGQFYKNPDESVKGKMNEISKIIFVSIPGGIEHSRVEFVRIIYGQPSFSFNSRGFFAARRDINSVLVFNYNTKRKWKFKNPWCSLNNYV